MNKTESIARRILGWKLNRWDRWYDNEKNAFISTADFKPEQNLNDALLIVDRLENLGYTYTTDGVSEVSFDNISGTGKTLADAITNAAFTIVEKNSVTTSASLWAQLC